MCFSYKTSQSLPHIDLVSFAIMKNPSVRHGPGWPMGPRAGLGYGLGRALNLGISTGSGRARAESSIQITILFYTIKLIIHDKSSFLIHEQRSCKVNQPAFEVQTAE